MVFDDVPLPSKVLDDKQKTVCIDYLMRHQECYFVLTSV